VPFESTGRETPYTCGERDATQKLKCRAASGVFPCGVDLTETVLKQNTLDAHNQTAVTNPRVAESLRILDVVENSVLKKPSLVR